MFDLLDSYVAQLNIPESVIEENYPIEDKSPSIELAMKELHNQTKNADKTQKCLLKKIEKMNALIDKLKECSHDIQNMESKHDKNMEKLNETREKIKSLVSSKTKTKENESASCVVCLDERPNVLLMPCAHACLCTDCSNNPQLVKCPMCRGIIINKITFFPS